MDDTGDVSTLRRISLSLSLLAYEMLSVLTPCGLNLQLVLLKDPLREFFRRVFQLWSLLKNQYFQVPIPSQWRDHRPKVYLSDKVSVFSKYAKYPLFYKRD